MSKEPKDTASVPPRKSSIGSLRTKFVQTVRPEIVALTKADALADDVQKILSSTPPPAIPRAPRPATGTGFRKKKRGV